MSLDEDIVRDRLFHQNQFGNFRGGGKDKVSAALANFINARDDARARALRNREIANRNWVGVSAGGGTPEGFTPWQQQISDGGYTFGDAISSADYGNDINKTSPNKYTFNEEDYVPNVNNGYHLSDANLYGNPTDFQRQKAMNAIGVNYDDGFKPVQKEYFPMNGQGVGDNTMNITSQPIGQNYNQRIGSQYKNSLAGGTQGMNVPQSPKGFGQVFQNAEDGSISVGLNGKKIDPFAIPASQDNTVQVDGGNKQVPPRMKDHFGDSPYLTEDYKYDNWNQRAINAGIDDEISRRVLYEERIKPLIKEARDEELRQAFFALQDPNASEQQKMDAMALIEYHRKDPFLEEDHQYKMGNVENPDYGSGSSAGNAVLKALGDYTEGDQWMSPDGTGNSRTQCSNFVSDVLRKIGLNIGSPNGDELMRQFGSAYHQGMDGIQAGDVLNFKDHVGIYVGNGQYVARNSSGGVHQGSMEEAIQAFGQPLGYGSVGELTGTSNRQKYIKDPNRISKLDLLNMQHQNRLEEIAARNSYRNPKNGTTVDADGYIKGSGDRNNALIDGINWYANASERKPEDLMKKVVNPLSDVFVDKLVQFKNEGDALEQLAYELVGGEKFGSSGMSDEQLAEVIGEAAMKASNNKRIRYQTSGKNAIKQRLIKDILPRLHGDTPQTSTGNGTPSNTQGSEDTSLAGKTKPYDENAKGGSNKPKTKQEMQELDPLMFSENGLTEQEEFRNTMMRPVDWGSIFHVTSDPNRNENLTYKW